MARSGASGVKILVTGAAGFLGSRLVGALLADGAARQQPTRIVAADVVPCPIDDARVEARVGTIAEDTFVRSLVDRDTAAVYHLAAVLSGQSEAEFDAGMRVNIDGTRSLLEAARRAAARPRFVFASTIAVFGGPLPAVVSEDVMPRPQSSYGAAKAIGELLVHEYSRRGFVDGVAVRLATVAIRPGRPNSALSSFVSGIVREPLAGIDSACPVPLDTRLWISSPGTVTANLVHAAGVPSEAFADGRTLHLPGLSVTPADMLAALEAVGGPAARARVRLEPDDRVARIVCSWPGALDDGRARRLGFVADRDVESIVRQYASEQRAAASNA
jgi:nucleoside-diphosphate-sugar epimerase